MPIDRQNKPYDPSQNKPGATVNTEGRGMYPDHDDGPFKARLNRPPKPGISGGLLAWVLTCAAITIIICSALLAILR
jgi:hypothetical protein